MGAAYFWRTSNWLWTRQHKLFTLLFNLGYSKKQTFLFGINIHRDQQTDDDAQGMHCDPEISAPMPGVTMTQNKTSSFGDDSYASFGKTHVSEKKSKYILSQHVQKILPSSYLYKYLEYEERPNSNTNGITSNNFRVILNIRNLSTQKEFERWVSDFAASSNIKYNIQGGYKRKGVKVIFAPWYNCQCKRKKLRKN